MTDYYSDVKKYFKNMFGCQSKFDTNEESKEIEVARIRERLSYVPIPVAHVLRDGKKYLIDAKDIIVSDLVYLDAKVSGVIPADLIMYETSPDFEIGSYLDVLDPRNKHLF